MLNGKPINDWDFMTRAFNAVSPISLNLDQSPGRNMLFESGYDLRLSTYYAPDGTNLTDLPRVRSEFQQAIGVQNLERQLDKLAQDPRIQDSIKQMYADIRAGKRGQYNARDYYHNIIIKRLFDKARKTAWRKISSEGALRDLVLEQRAQKQLQKAKQNQTALLNIYK